LEILKVDVNCFEILPAKAKLSAYTGHDIPAVGEVDLAVEFNSVQLLIKFQVSEASNAMPILGLNAEDYEFSVA